MNNFVNKEHIVCMQLKKEEYDWLISQMKSWGLKSLSDYFKIIFAVIMILDKHNSNHEF